MVPPLDECQFCVREFWQPWLQQLLDIEDEARVEERKATFGARDALSKSERDLALNLRLYAADALLSIRAAKKDVMKAIAAIEAEKAKRKSIDKEKYGIEIKRSTTNTHYKEAMAKAFKSKQLQEHKFEIMKLWSERWADRQAEEEEDEPEPEPIPLKSLFKHPEDDGTKRASHELTRNDRMDSDHPVQKPALKKKEDGHDKDVGHKITHLASPSGQAIGPGPAHGADKGSAKATVPPPPMPDKKAHVPDKGVVIKEPEPGSRKTSTTGKKEGSTPEGKAKDKTAAPHHPAEKHDSEKKEPAIAHAPDKATPEKKEHEPSSTSDKAPTAPPAHDKKTEPSSPPSPPKPDTKPPPEPKKEPENK